MNKNILSLSTLIVALAIAYYIAIYLPQLNNLKLAEIAKQQVLENQLKCTKDGKNFFEEFVKANYSVGDNKITGPTSFDNPEFHYNVKLNTCLVYTRYLQLSPWEQGLGFHYNRVTDINSNKAILLGEFSRFENKETIFASLENVPNYTSSDFFKQKDILFNE